MIVSMGTITLTDVERVELNRRAMSRAGRADDARRARLILLLDAAETWAAIREKLDCNDAFIDRWSKRYLAERLAGLFSRHAGQEATRLSPQLEARILEWTVKRKPADGSTHWSTRKLAEQLGISHMMVARVWRKHALRPQRLDRYMASDDPDFEKKAADIFSGCTWIRRPTRRSSASMRSRTFRLLTGSIRGCRCPREPPSGQGLGTTAT